MSGAIYLPLARLNHWQTDLPDLNALNELTHETSDLVNLSTITVRGDAFEPWGASATDELALTLSWWVAYCDQLTDLGLSIETILACTELSLSTDADYFIGLAKFRALRYLINKIAQAYGVAENAGARPRVRAVSGLRNKTYYDPDSNLLRNTTEALACLLGGVDTLSLHPTTSSVPRPIRLASGWLAIPTRFCATKRSWTRSLIPPPDPILSKTLPGRWSKRAGSSSWTGKIREDSPSY